MQTSEPERSAQVGGRPRRSDPVVVAVGGVGGTARGLTGLGGAEFRLPLLIGLFGFAALQAVILDKAMSLVVVLTALPARLFGVPLADVPGSWTVAANLLAGSLAGAWAGATWATRMRSRTLHQVLAGLLVLIAVVLVAGHLGRLGTLSLAPAVQAAVGVVAGFLIGVVAALMGVAGGELLIPTIVLLHGADTKLAGSLSLVVSLPTMLVAFARYSRDDSFVVLRSNVRFAGIMASGSVTGTLCGGLLLGVVPDAWLIPLLAGLLVISARKVWQHR